MIRVEGFGLISVVVPPRTSEFRGRPLACARFNEGLGALLAVDHPRYAEAVDEHAETRGPECFLDRHLHLPFIRQCVKDAFCLGRFFDLERNGEAFPVNVHMQQIEANVKQTLDTIYAELTASR
jgi:hypothetical protein